MWVSFHRLGSWSELKRSKLRSSTFIPFALSANAMWTVSLCICCHDICCCDVLAMIESTLQLWAKLNSSFLNLILSSIPSITAVRRVANTSVLGSLGKDKQRKLKLSVSPPWGNHYQYIHRLPTLAPIFKDGRMWFLHISCLESHSAFLRCCRYTTHS